MKQILHPMCEGSLLDPKNDSMREVVGVGAVGLDGVRRMKDQLQALAACDFDSHLRQ
jgi:hypothetical protein